MHSRGKEALRALDAPATVSELPGGVVRIEKAGITGDGPTRDAAALDWLCHFSAAIARPKPTT